MGDRGMPSGPSTTSPSPTSTVYQPDGDTEAIQPQVKEKRVHGKVPDEERGLPANDPRPAAELSNEKGEDWVVKWDGPDDPGCPLNTPAWKKWMMTFIVAGACVCVTCCSSMAGSTYDGMTVEYGISRIVATLTISLYVAGLGVGPMFLGPVSEFIGRKKVLHYSFACFFLLNFPVAFANNVSVHMIFRFLTGFAGSAFLSVSGGAISDVFKNEHVATSVGVYTSGKLRGPGADVAQTHDDLLGISVPRTRSWSACCGLHQSERELALDLLRRYHLVGNHSGSDHRVCTGDV